MSLYEKAKVAETELFVEYDKLNHEYSEWQKLFANLHLPEGCWVCWQTSEMEGSPWSEVLGVYSNGDIYFAVWEDDDDKISSRKSLANASAAARVEGLSHLGDLWRKACAFSRLYIDTVKSKTSEAQATRMKVMQTIEPAPAA